ncbi:Domain of uncharacterised function (DUF2825) [Actinomyces denticolens]|nr:Domain of uncharacterised function (DUF2825) [Actinomyces denticolens]
MDHPRIRGVHGFSDDAVHGVSGSSPHTRGARDAVPPDFDIQGIIPAYAGCTLRRSASGTPSGDHPRIRGVHARRGGWSGAWLGSSPHTRGAPDRRPGAGGPPGIIPAYAGCTAIQRYGPAEFQDHPRIRGVHARDLQFVRRPEGSSPHTRGAPNTGQLKIPANGIIPAYAGCTRLRRLIDPGRPDHPRIRGVHPPVSRITNITPGSSPHTRGARLQGGGPHEGAGIIPAYAGCTFVLRVPRIPPRGSSPHTRGAPKRFLLTLWGDRIIPAYAGCTLDLSPARPRRPDHPRIRGVHFRIANFLAPYDGSSPHTRGALGARGWLTNDDGIIPAYAGCTHAWTRR